MAKPKFVICTENQGFEASLEVRKLYQMVPDPAAESLNQIRVVDESGEDYLYPAEFFIPLDLPKTIALRVANSA